nr:MAG TPA: hypothetical protein [Caudoviricetes sp.]
MHHLHYNIPQVARVDLGHCLLGGHVGHPVVKTNFFCHFCFLLAHCAKSSVVVFCNVGPDQCFDVSGLVGYAVEFVDNVGFCALHRLKMIMYGVFSLPYIMGIGLFCYCFFASYRL